MEASGSVAKPSDMKAPIVSVVRRYHDCGIRRYRDRGKASTVSVVSYRIRRNLPARGDLPVHPEPTRKFGCGVKRSGEARGAGADRGGDGDGVVERWAIEGRQGKVEGNFDA